MDEDFIANRLARLRTQKDVSAREMSYGLGQANNYINNIELKKSYPSVQALGAICEYLGITLSEFFDEGTKYPPLLHELIEELKPMDDESLTHLLAIARKMKKDK